MVADWYAATGSVDTSGERQAGKAIDVALNDTACKVLKEQIGRHHKFVFVHNSASTALMEQRLLR